MATLVPTFIIRWFKLQQTIQIRGCVIISMYTLHLVYCTCIPCHVNYTKSKAKRPLCSHLAVLFGPLIYTFLCLVFKNQCFRHWTEVQSPMKSPGFTMSSSNNRSTFYSIHTRMHNFGVTVILDTVQSTACSNCYSWHSTNHSLQ